jgi:hypothetical protein
MIELTTKAILQEFTPRNPEQWDSVDTWTPKRKFLCGYATLSSEQRVRAGMDSADRALSVWYKDQALRSGDRLKIKNDAWLVVYVDEQGDVTGLNYCIVKAAP